MALKKEIHNIFHIHPNNLYVELILDVGNGLIPKPYEAAGRIVTFGK